MANRIQHIDIAKGISISLVALFHSPLKSFFPETIAAMSLFRMPLFFFLSGIFFSCPTAPGDHIKKKAEALLKPYFGVLFLVLFIKYLSGTDYIMWQLKGVFYGNGDTIAWTPLWFLPHLFAVSLLAYILFRYCRFQTLNYGIKIALIVLLMTVGSIFIKKFWHIKILVFNHTVELPGLPFSLDIIPITTGYFVCGNLLKDTIVKFQARLTHLLLATSLFLLICMCTDANTDLNKRVYDYPIFATIGAFSGIYITISAAWYISARKWLSYIPLRLGESSLYILLFHSVIQSNIYKILTNGIRENSSLLILSIISFGLGLSIPLGIKWLVSTSDILSLVFLPFESNRLLHRMFSARR